MTVRNEGDTRTDVILLPRWRIPRTLPFALQKQYGAGENRFGTILHAENGLTGGLRWPRSIRQTDCGHHESDVSILSVTSSSENCLNRFIPMIWSIFVEQSVHTVARTDPGRVPSQCFPHPPPGEVRVGGFDGRDQVDDHVRWPTPADRRLPLGYFHLRLGKFFHAHRYQSAGKPSEIHSIIQSVSYIQYSFSILSIYRRYGMYSNIKICMILIEKIKIYKNVDLV